MNPKINILTCCIQEVRGRDNREDKRGENNENKRGEKKFLLADAHLAPSFQRGKQKNI